MPTTEEIIKSLRVCPGYDFDCTQCAYYDAADEHLDKLHLDASLELERLDKKLKQVRNNVVYNIEECKTARDGASTSSLRDQFYGCITALNFVLRWIDEEDTCDD